LVCSHAPAARISLGPGVRAIDLDNLIFISHSSKDKAAALDVQRRLLGYGYDESQLFLDSDAETGIPAGSKWEQVLYRRLKDCRALIVLCSPKWQESRWCFAELVYAKAMGKEIFPVLLEECAIEQVAAEHQAVFVYKDGEAAYTRLWNALDSRHLGPRDEFGWPPKDGDHCPFPGLPSFDERLAGVYFGREAETQAILEDLRRMRANGEPRLLMIVGGSGSGKSSLLKAGVLPRLKHKTFDTEWVVVPTLRYGEQVNQQRTIFDQLAVNLVALFPNDTKSATDWRALSTALVSKDVKSAVKLFLETSQDLTLARNCSDATVLVAIDQFEELLVPSAGAIAAEFLRFLKQLLNCANSQLLVVGTMRSDHLDIYERSLDVLPSPFFYPWRLGPFPWDRIEEVIRKPTNRANVEITNELVERLKRDTPTAEALPLLAFTLEKLYRGYSSDARLELQEYESLGGMEGAIQKCIERVVPPNSLSEAEAAALRLSFVKHLAQANDRGEVVRLRTRWDDLPTAAKPILEKFVNERLLIRSGDNTKPSSVTIEVAHEAMFRCWGDLKEWLRTSSDILRWRRDVRRDQANDPKWSGLLPAQLAVARDWPKRRRDELSRDEVDSINRGIRWEMIRRGIVLAVVLVVTLSAGTAWWQKKVADDRKQEAEVAKAAAETQAQIANIRRLAAESSSVLKERPQRSLLLAIETIRAAQTLHGISMVGDQEPLREALSTVGGRPVAKATGPITAVAISPDSRWAVTGSSDNTVRLSELSARDPVATSVILRGHEGSIDAVAVSADSHWVVTGSHDNTARLWNLNTKDPAASALVLRGHESAVTAVAISADNHWVVTGSEDRTARVWDLSAKDPAANPVILRGHEGDLIAVAISADDHWVVTGSSDKTARLWDLSAKDSAATSIVLHGHEQELTAVAISADSHWIVTGSSDKTARLWDLSAKDPAANPTVLRGHDRELTAVAISADSHWIVTGSSDKTARLWDLSAKDPTANPAVLRGHDDWVTAVAISTDNHWVVTGSQDRTARVWDLNAKNPAANPTVLRGHESDLTAVAISADNHWVVTGSSDNTARVWDLSAKDPAANPVILRGHERELAAMAISADNHWVVTGGSDNTARIWDLSMKDPAANSVILRGHEGVVDAVTVSPDNHWVVTGSSDNTARIWDLSAKDPAANPVILRGHEHKVDAVAVSADNHWVVTGSSDNTARVWDLSAKDPAANPVILRGHERAVTAVAISRNNHWVVTISYDKTARVWDLSAKNPAANPLILRGHEQELTAVAISPDSRWVVTGSKDETARVWDLSAKDPPANPVVLAGHDGSVTALGISADNRWVVTGSSDNTARIWDLSAKDPAADPKVLRGHESAITAVAISADNHWIVTGSYDNTARVWDLSAKDPAANPAILRGHEGRVTAVAISQDNHWAVTGGEDGTARLWLLQVEDLIDLARITVGRNFSAGEWKRYFPGEPYRKTFAQLPGANEDPSSENK
jgi:WD40 repeat protein